MKKFLTFLASFCIAAVMLFSGCGLFMGEDGKDGLDGRDGKDGKDGASVTIYDLYEAAKQEHGGELTFDEFLRDYLSYSGSEINAAASLQASVNRSLMSAVTVLSRFKYGSYGFYTYKVFTGSGVILSVDKEAGDAYVVTNCHVVFGDTSADANYISECVRLYLYGQDVNGVNFTLSKDRSTIYDYGYGIVAEVMCASATYDIALLKVTNSDIIKRSEVVAASFSDAEDVYLGETVYAIGNASSEGMSASNGIISKDSEFISLNLSDKYSDDDAAISYRVMRTTAPINHGNSGGGLFNADGEIVGIVNAKDDDADADNMGYVLPGNLVKRLLKLMYDQYSGYYTMGVKKAYLGVETSVSDSYARYDEESNRAVITEILRVKKIDSFPAYGKLMVGDIFKKIRIVDSDGNEKENLTVTREYHVRDVMFSVRFGDTVYVTVERGGVEIEVAIVYNNNSYFKITDTAELNS